MTLSELNNEFKFAGRSTRDRVSGVLRSAILMHIFTSGERLVELMIAKELNVSITPVREAFARLAIEGLLTVIPFKGTYVTEITHEFSENLIFVRERLETAAMELCFDRLTEEDILMLTELNKHSDSAALRGEILEAVNYDVSFHDFFFQKGQNDLLIELWGGIKNRIKYVQSYTRPKHAGYSNYVCRRHKPIIDGISSGDKAACIAALSEHIRTSSQYVVLDDVGGSRL